MAQEERRRAGFRRVGGLYLVSEKIYVDCDRLPIVLKKCPCCGRGINLCRNVTGFQPNSEFGKHNILCTDKDNCPTCYPPEGQQFIMIVGKHLYPKPQDFIDEAIEMGVSKRIPFLAKGIVLGKTIIYLAHEKASPEGWAIFAYFIPVSAERLVWMKDFTPAEVQRNRSLGIDTVGIPDGDMDHAAYTARRVKPIFDE